MRATPSQIEWLTAHSFLKQGERCLQNSKPNWGVPFIRPQPEQVARHAGVWWTSYPPATLTPSYEGKELSVIGALSSPLLWKALSTMGVKALHTGPVKLSGGIDLASQEYTSTCDGWFDRIEMSIDPAFGDDQEIAGLVSVARDVGCIICGDIIPGHTGRGADFLLTLLDQPGFGGLYVATKIPQELWPLLPAVPIGESVNLSHEVVDALTKHGLLPGHPQRVMYSVPGEPPKTAYDVTGEVITVTGEKVRWVFMHYFKPGQPTLNWVDSNASAQRLVNGDIVQSLDNGFKILRLDANPFLGLERIGETVNAHSEGTQIAVQASNSIAWTIRRHGGWSFQELNLGLGELKAFTEFGADLSYDFITRTAYFHALLTGNPALLRLMIELMAEYSLEPRTFIHALQNHDEITYELVHFLANPTTEFTYGNDKLKGKVIRDTILAELREKTLTDKTPYNGESGNGVCTTLTGFACSALGITNPWSLDSTQLELVQRGHLLMAIYNAIRPGIFALSAWDMVGALPLRRTDTNMDTLLADGDYRWLNRGAIDVTGDAEDVVLSKTGLPRAHCLYGSLPSQSAPTTFASQLRRLIHIRNALEIPLGDAAGLPDLATSHTGPIAIAYKMNERIVTLVMNWSTKACDVSLKVDSPDRTPCRDILIGVYDYAQHDETKNIYEGGVIVGEVSSGRLNLSLDGWTAQLIVTN